MSENRQNIIKLGLSVLEIEARAILDLAQHIDQVFVEACELILACEGRIVVTGIGKSGHIGNKIAATLASTGTPAFFLHAAEAAHGDLGMITQKDLVLALSHSGETPEIINIIPHIKRLSIPIITLCGNPHSTLSKLSDVYLNVGIKQEACPLGLAPTASTTVTLAMGDALAIAVLEARGFTVEDFAHKHPGGGLGKRLKTKLLKIEDIMRVDQAIPKVIETASLSEALLEMTQKRLGFTTIVAKDNSAEMLGIFTDGDLRRAFEQGVDVHNTPVHQAMTKNCKYVTQGTLAVEAVKLMEEIKSFAVPVLSKKGELVGALNMHDLLQAGVI